ncbi:MAG: hypothetical protein ACOYLE_09315 [Bacteroidales bacterium]
MKYKIRVAEEIVKDNVKALLVADNNEYADNELFVEKCLYYLQFLFIKQILHHKKVGIDGFIPLSAKILSNKFGSHSKRIPYYYKFIEESLVKIGLLEIDHRYIPNNGNGNCKGYKLLLKEPFKLKDSLTEGKIYREFRNDNTEHVDNLKEISIDEKMFVLISNIVNTGKREAGIYILDYWMHDLHFSLLDKNRRVYSFITQMPREYRCALSINNKPIYEVDIHACHPFLYLKAVEIELNKDIKRKKTIVELGEELPEIKQYISAIQRGVFYTDLYEIYLGEMGKRGRKNKAMDLKDFKTGILAMVFYAKEKDSKRKSLIKRIFEEQYPIIQSKLNYQKETYGHYSISKNLQSMESELMNKIIKVIKKEQMWHVRLHDAILCEGKDCDLIQKITNDCIEEYIGLTGRVKTGIWAKDLKEIMDHQMLALYEVKKMYDFSEYIIKKVAKKRSEIFRDPTKDKSEKKEVWSKYNRFLNYEPVYEVYYKAKKAKMLETGVVLPIYWDENEIAKYKKYGYELIIKHIIQQTDVTNSWDVKMLERNITYWGGIYA